MSQRRNIVHRDADGDFSYISKPDAEIEEEDAGVLCDLFGSAFGASAFLGERLESEPLDKSPVSQEPHPFDAYIRNMKARAGSPPKSAPSEPEWNNRFHWSTGEEQLSQDLKRIIEFPTSLCRKGSQQPGHGSKAEWSPQGRGREYMEEIVRLKSEGLSGAGSAFERADRSDSGESEWTQIKEINFAFGKEREDIYGHKLDSLPRDDEISNKSSQPFVLSDESETQDQPVNNSDEAFCLPARPDGRVSLSSLNKNHSSSRAWHLQRIPEQEERPLQQDLSQPPWWRGQILTKLIRYSEQIPSPRAQPALQVLNSRPHQERSGPLARDGQQLPNPQQNRDITTPLAPSRQQWLDPKLNGEMQSLRAQSMQHGPDRPRDDKISSPRAHPSRPICDNSTQTTTALRDLARGFNQKDGLRVALPERHGLLPVKASTQPPLPLHQASPQMLHAAHSGDGQLNTLAQTPNNTLHAATKKTHSSTESCGHDCIFRHTTIDGQEYHVWSPPNEEGYRTIPLKTANPLAACCLQLTPTPDESLASPHPSHCPATPRQELRAATRAVVDFCRPLTDKRNDGNAGFHESRREKVASPVAVSEGRELLEEAGYESVQFPTMMDAYNDLQHDPSGVPSSFQPLDLGATQPAPHPTRSSNTNNGYIWYTQPPVNAVTATPTLYVVAPEYQLPNVLLEPQHMNQWKPCYKCKNVAVGFQCHCKERDKRTKDWIKDRIFWQPKQRYPCARQTYDKERTLYLRNKHRVRKFGWNALL